MVREALTAEKLGALEPREAAALFVARRAEGLTASEQQLLDVWLAKNDDNRRQFENADRAWQTFAASAGDEILAAMRAHALAPRPRSGAGWWPAAAAAAVLLVAIGLVWNFMPSSGTFEYVSLLGEVKEFQLSDGSSVTLDGESALTGRFSGKSRSIELQRGRALFAVAHDPSRPFSVTAAGRRVVAVGTRFDVNLLDDGLTVTLLEGRVDVESLDATTALAKLDAGQQYVERRGKVEIRTLSGAGESAISWRKGLVNFDDQPLSDAVAVMNRYSPEQITIRDPDVASLRVSGQFRAGDSQRFAETLAEMHGLRAIRQDHRIELVREK
ncbi:MAG: FecR domain-containing protein [Pseudomonadota bacterium]